MKTIRIVLLAIVFSFSIFSYGQNNLFSINQFGSDLKIIGMEIDSTFYSSGLVYSITNGSISGLSVTADFKLYSYEGYIRILLSDLEHEQDYLVYEAYYPLNGLNTPYHIEDYTYESNMLYNLSNVVVRVEIHNGECYLDRVNYSITPCELDKEQFDKDKRKQKILQDSILLASLNQRIKEERCLWYAGSTTVSELYYDQRKYMLPKNEEHEIPNLQGFEYYKGGIFEVRTDSIQSRTTVTSNYVDEFDWRNRHGRNWMTPPKEQDCNHCWVFCPVSVAESSVNLYFNQSIDYDLSEQHVASCSGGNNGICFDGNISTSVAFIANQGVVVESCFPYMGQDPPNIPCGNVCSNPLETVSFNNYSLIQKSVDNIKKAVIENGPVCGGLFSLHHFMSIIGFKTLKEGDNVYSGEQYPLTNMTIQPNSPYIGQTCWLFKNSMGTNWGDGGYAYIFTQDINNLYGLYKLVTPETQMLNDDDVICEDKDGDGYYNWGIGPKPATCPDCPDERDCDDSDPTLGPYGLDYDCINYCDLQGDTTTIRITSVETWNNGGFIRGNIEIDSNAILTITSKIHMDINRKIIVHPGGKLIIDGGRLTCSCNDNMWQGIEVWGNSDMNQFTIGGVCAQGQLELLNGATIENAVCAVELCRPGVSGTSGGIVHADSAVFINNAKAVHAQYYSNWNPLLEHESNYNSSFINCTFSINGNYLGTETFYEHVELDHVNGITFKGCRFSCSDNAQNISSSCFGINAFDAGFFVEAICNTNMGFYNHVCPDEYIIRSSFMGFYDAVHSVSDVSVPYTFGVKDAIFSNNKRGVFAHNTGYATILRNRFTVYGEDNCCFGVYLNEVSGFCVEENVFIGRKKKSEDYGVGVFNCEGGNEVYLNSFNSLSCGNYAKGRNATSTGEFSPGNVNAGLIYSCNHNNGNNIDFCVQKDGGNGGIHPNQGSSTEAAGNTFDGSLFHFYNDGEYMVNYWYYNGDPDEIPSNSLLYGVSANATSNHNRCASHYGVVVKDEDEKNELRKIYQSSSDWHERYLAAGDIVRSDLHDTISNPEELRTWLSNLSDISADRVCIASFMHEGDFVKATQLAEKLPHQYDLEGDDLEAHAQYMLLINLYKTLFETHRTVCQLSDSERNLVENLAENGLGFPQSMALAIMDHISENPNRSYSCPTLPTIAKNNAIMENNKVPVSKGFNVVLMPNPTSSQVRVNYTLPEGCQQALLELVTTLGIKVESVVLEGEKGSKEVLLENLSQGVYGYTVRCGDDVLSGKLIIMR